MPTAAAPSQQHKVPQQSTQAGESPAPQFPTPRSLVPWVGTLRLWFATYGSHTVSSSASPPVSPPPPRSLPCVTRTVSRRAATDAVLNPPRPVWSDASVSASVIPAAATSSPPTMDSRSSDAAPGATPPPLPRAAAAAAGSSEEREEDDMAACRPVTRPARPARGVGGGGRPRGGRGVPECQWRQRRRQQPRRWCSVGDAPFDRASAARPGPPPPLYAERGWGAAAQRGGPPVDAPPSSPWARHPPQQTAARHQRPTAACRGNAWQRRLARGRSPPQQPAARRRSGGGLHRWRAWPRHTGTPLARERGRRNKGRAGVGRVCARVGATDARTGCVVLFHVGSPAAEA